MALSGFLFLSWRIFQIVMLVPPVGMLGWFVHQYVSANLLTPDYVLVLFIVVTLALAWTFFTTISYLRARHDALFIAFIDLCFIGAFIAGVYYLRGWATANCSSFDAGRNGDTFFINVTTNKQCSMLKASFAFGIILLLTFPVTFFLALLVHHHHKDDDRVVVRREYRHSHHGSHGRSRSRDHGRSSRDYGYNGPRASSGHRSHHSSRRQYYV